MPKSAGPRTSAGRTLVLLLALLVPAALGATCESPETPESGKQLFASPQANPIALSADGTRLFVANTTSGTVSVLDVTTPTSPQLVAEIAVGLDPVALAVRPKLDPGDTDEDELIFVANHISDSVNVISTQQLGIVQTLQELDAEGVTRTDDPVGIAFAGPNLAFVALDTANQVIALDLDAAGRASIRPTRLDITAQAPRAVAVAGNRLYVAAFESGNQTEFSTCGPDDTRGISEGDPFDEGCSHRLSIIDDIVEDSNSLFDVNLGAIFDFAAVNPNLGGRVVIDRDRPDRDLFVYDLDAPDFDSDPVAPGVQPLQVVDGVGTLLYGLATGAGGRVYVTNTDGRNHLDGLLDLANRMFDNRLTYLDCAGGCGAPAHVDLDASAGAGATVPTPYGVAVSADGNTLVVTGSGSDGKAPGSPGTPGGQPEIWGLAVLDADGHVQGGLRTGAIPQGVALRSHGQTGAAEWAFVLDTVDSALSVVDVSNPASPQLALSGFAVGNDPTPPDVKAGRIHFMSARASTSGTFSCESCHPGGNIDQILWTINSLSHPDDPGPFIPEIPEPRTTMPIRGLRDTLPLHWQGNLGDPNPGLFGLGVVGDNAPDCDMATDGEVGCARHLVNASLKGVMCDPLPSCAFGDSGHRGALTGEERDELAKFLMSLPYPPAPNRRPTDQLSAQALIGVQDFFTEEDGFGIADGIGEVVNFAPRTCADNAMGCHSLPLTASTNSVVVGGFDVPSARGMWDRHVYFSNGVFSSEEAMKLAQDCADGIEPLPKVFNLALLPVPLVLTGDPCNLDSPLIEEVLGFNLAEVPFPSGAVVYDPAVGITERGAFMATFEHIFTLVYGVRGDNIWEYQVEIGLGLPGLTGRQVSVEPGNASLLETVAAMDQIEAAAEVGKIAAVARGIGLEELRYDKAVGSWVGPTTSFSGAGLRQEAVDQGRVITVTAELPRNISIGGADRQPLLDVNPDKRLADFLLFELQGKSRAPQIPRPAANAPASFRLGAEYVEPGATVLINGAPCGDCSFLATTAPVSGKNAIDVTVPGGFPSGINVMQVLNPEGWSSNEMPVFAE